MKNIVFMFALLLWGLLCFSQDLDNTIYSGAVSVSCKTDVVTNNLVLIASSNTSLQVTLTLFTTDKREMYWDTLVNSAFPYYTYELCVGSTSRNVMYCALNPSDTYRLGVEYDSSLYQYVLVYKKGWQIKNLK